MAPWSMKRWPFYFQIMSPCKCQTIFLDTKLLFSPLCHMSGHLIICNNLKTLIIVDSICFHNECNYGEHIFIIGLLAAAKNKQYFLWPFLSYLSSPLTVIGKKKRKKRLYEKTVQRFDTDIKKTARNLI